MFNFVKTVPPVQGRTYLDTDRLEELVDELLQNANQWAQVPATFFYPELEGAEAQKLKVKARAVAGRIQKDMVPVLNQYSTQAKSRGTDVYVRIVSSPREARELKNLY